MSRAAMVLGVCVALSALPGRATAATVREAIDGLAWDNALTDEKREDLIATLVATQAAEDIERFVESDARIAKDTDGEELEPLVGALKRMGTPRAVAALRAMAFSSVFAVDDVAMWDVLAARLQSGSDPAGSPLMRELWKLQPADARRALGAPATAELADGLKRRVVHGLNRAVKARLLFQSRTNSGSLPGEGDRLLETHRTNLEPKPGNDPLPEYELQRLNRILIEEELGTALTPFRGIALKHARPEIAALGLKALGEMDNASAREIALAERPTSFYAMKAHLQIAERIDSADAVVALVPYLLDRNSAFLLRARVALVKRAEAHAAALEAEMLDLVIGLNPVDNKDLSESACTSIVTVGAALPAANAARIMVHLLDNPLPKIVDATFASLVEKPANVSVDVVNRLRSMAAESADKILAMRVLRVLRESKATSGIDIVERYLQHEDVNVQSMASTVLRVLTGKMIVSPSEWRRQIAHNPNVLQPGTPVAVPPGAAVLAAPAADEGSNLWWYVGAAAAVVVFVLLIVALRNR